MVSTKVIIPSSNSRACPVKRVELVRYGNLIQALTSPISRREPVFRGDFNG
jgi:hypothetical protein